MSLSVSFCSGWLVDCLSTVRISRYSYEFRNKQSNEHFAITIPSRISLLFQSFRKLLWYLWFGFHVQMYTELMKNYYLYKTNGHCFWPCWAYGAVINFSTTKRIKSMLFVHAISSFALIFPAMLLFILAQYMCVSTSHSNTN